VAIDRVQPLKIEAPESGGVETDQFPTSLDRNEDYLDCRGVALQNTTSDDEVVRVDRDSSDNLVFEDPNAGSHTLSSLIGGGFDINNVVWDTEGDIVYDCSEQAVTKV
jgi:hypothetical protein